MTASVEAILVGWLEDQTGVTATAVTPDKFDPPLLHVEELPGGRQTAPGRDTCVVAISAYAVESPAQSAREAAFDLAHLARRLLLGALAGHTADGAVVHYVTERSKPVPSDSGDSVTARYEGTYELQLRLLQL